MGHPQQALFAFADRVGQRVHHRGDPADLVLAGHLDAMAVVALGEQVADRFGAPQRANDAAGDTQREQGPEQQRDGAQGPYLVPVGGDLCMQFRRLPDRGRTLFPDQIVQGFRQQVQRLLGLRAEHGAGRFQVIGLDQIGGFEVAFPVLPQAPENPLDGGAPVVIEVAGFQFRERAVDQGVGRIDLRIGLHPVVSRQADQHQQLAGGGIGGTTGLVDAPGDLVLLGGQLLVAHRQRPHAVVGDPGNRQRQRQQRQESQRQAHADAQLENRMEDGCHGLAWPGVPPG